MEKFLANREDLNQRYKSPQYKSLKYTAIGFFVADMILLATMTVIFDSLSDWWYLFLRGCAGLLGLVGLIISAVYIYLINRDFVHDKYIRRKDND